MVTLNDVAKRAGVSKSTVSRALNGDPSLSITRQTKEKIMEAVIELGYLHKRNRVLSTVYQIAVIHKETHYQNQLDNAFYFSVRYGMESVCHSLGVNCCFLPNTMLKELPSNLDGVIINGNYSSDQMAEIIHFIGDIPAVVVARQNFAKTDKDWVTFDVQDTVKIAMEHLVSRGKRTFLYIGGRDYEGTPDCQRKLFHYQKFMDGHKELRGIGEVEGDYGIQSGYDMMSAWIEAGNPLPEAVFASHDPIAVGVVRVLAERGIAVPEKVAVVGVNGDSICNLTVPPLTTVTVHAEKMGREAVRVLMECIEHQYEVARKIIFRAELVPGRST